MKELTERQWEILRHIADGKSNAEIALEEGIAFHTAHRHREMIMKKLGLHKAALLTRYYIEHKVQSLSLCSFCNARAVSQGILLPGNAVVKVCTLHSDKVILVNKKE